MLFFINILGWNCDMSTFKLKIFIFHPFEYWHSITTLQWINLIGWMCNLKIYSTWNKIEWLFFLWDFLGVLWIWGDTAHNTNTTVQCTTWAANEFPYFKTYINATAFFRGKKQIQTENFSRFFKNDLEATALK